MLPASFNLSNTFTYYHLQHSCSKVMFSQASVILFTGVCVSQHALGQTPPAQCMLGYTPPTQCMLRYTPPPPVATAVGGMHPTGMHSCSYVNSILTHSVSLNKL